MKKKLLILSLAIVIVFMSSINVMAGYVCKTCGSDTAVYATGCKGIVYEIRENQLCATHSSCRITMHFYESSMFCMACDRQCMADYAAHLHKTYHSATGVEAIVCQWY